MPSVVKRAADPTGRARLRHEAAVLGRARHPGVIGPAVLDEDAEETTLAVPELAAPSLADAPPTDPRLARRIGAALARTVADLHDVGVAHGALDPAHVLLDGDRPVLCGFRDAVLEPTEDDRRRDDVALAALVDLLAASATARPDGSARRAAAVLRRVAERARVARPPMSAAELARLLATGTAPRLAWPTPHATSVLVRRVAAVLAVPTTVIVFVVLRPTGTGGHDDRDAASTTTATVPGVVSTGGTADEGADERAAPVVEAGGVRYAAGAAGDRLAVGDWTCSGTPSALLLRPATGELWLFPALPFGDETITAVALTTVPGAHDVDRVAATTPCAVPAVVDANGTRIPVEAR